MISWSDFEKIDIRVGTVLTSEPFPEANNPSYKLTIDFGDLGIKKTSAQITKQYKTADLIGIQVIAVVNFPPKQIANMMSECLVLGAVGDENMIALLSVDRTVKNGLKIG